jgi:Ca-activated chloride channel family protein
LTSFTFTQAWVIPLGLLALAAAVLLFRRLKNYATLDLPLGPGAQVSFTPPGRPKLVLGLLSVIEIIAVLLLIIAAAGPEIQTKETLYTSPGAEVFFVLDCSPSMAALDMSDEENRVITRFEAARRLVLNFADARPADSIGLAALGSEAALVLPSSTNRMLLGERLQGLHIGELGDGTALGLGLSIAALHLADSKAPRQAVILITDGENNAGSIHPETAAELLVSTGTSLYVIGVGSFGEVSFDYTDPVSGIERSGRFDSRFDTASLRKIAEAGGGIYLPAASFRAFSTAFEEISSDELVVSQTGTRVSSEALGNVFIVPALVLALFAAFVRRIILGAFI